MSQAQRVSRIHYLLKSHGHMSSQQLREELEVSRATLMRDIELMRDRLGAPIIYDSDKGYRYDPTEKWSHFGDKFELPGVWLRPAEGYAILTLVNVMRGIDPGFLERYLSPLRGVLKRVLADREYPMKGFDSKVKIDMPDFFVDRSFRQEHFRVFQALVEEKQVYLTWQKGSKLITGLCRLRRIVMRKTGWYIEAIRESSAKTTTIALNSIKECQIVRAVEDLSTEDNQGPIPIPKVHDRTA